MASGRTGDERPTVWDECDHVWSVRMDSQFEDEVVCEKCGCPGARNGDTGEVFWPAT